MAPDVDRPLVISEYLDPRDHLLLVEDSLFQARMLEGMLKTGGMDVEVLHAVSLADAHAALEGDVRMACIVLDLTLPDADGLDGVIDMCSAAPDVPIVVVTGDEDEARAIKAVQLGAQDYLTKDRIDPQALRRSIRYAIERKRSELMLAHQALHDALTGLPNRTLVEDRLRLALAQSVRRESMVAAMYCDLDGFKQVNDARGHAAGDRVLREVGARLLSSLRAGDTVGRYGGDEFMVVSSELDNEAAAIAVALRLRGAIARPFRISGGDEISISTSIGIGLVPGSGLRPADVIDAADAAMYRAKRSGTGYELIRL
jgi:diguanylate cyclase (GGDEF)-like protein